ncbi:calcium-binding protein [Acuticoccus sp. I52.16.1]|uniref:calcium-binding protein n=1 Tax=Acuticoccus sp. I52.16.1 TaxID=2928472 RepID=UPI001FD47CF1|nr:calcium-binding protein [Acuticoccus sp. I52.16.1]UOM32848.1 hypothetical protein MRB58_13285 [Acuticoccus sp. I52.16.1]
MASNPLIPSKTPFNYNVGLNYESWSYDRTGYSVSADISAITEDFKLIKTFHAAAVGTTTLEMDPTQAQVIAAVVAEPGVELVMGTNSSALAQLDTTTGTWTAGLMTSSTYTDGWVDMLIASFGSVTAVKTSLKTILLGNEIDANGPPPTDPAFANYVPWIESAFENLKASLAAKGLASIPVSTTIANYPLGDPSSNAVASEVTDYISRHWAGTWNGGEPFVLFNQYTPAVNGAPAKSTDFGAVIDYFDSVDGAVGGSLEPFVGETGYSAYYGANKQADVIGQIFDWLGDQRDAGGKTVPLFAFLAFDRPAASGWEKDYGIYAETATSQPNGFKPKLVSEIPGWTSAPINTQSAGHDALYGNAGANAFFARGGDDTLVGGAGADRLVAGPGDDIVAGGTGYDSLTGGHGNDTVDGGGGEDTLIGGAGDDSIAGGGGADTLAGGPGDDSLDGGDRDDFLFGRAGDDTLVGGRGDDVLVGGAGADVFALQDLPGTDVIRDFAAGDILGLTGDLSAQDLTFEAAGNGTHIFAGAELIAVVVGVSVADIAGADVIGL